MAPEKRPRERSLHLDRRAHLIARESTGGDDDLLSTIQLAAMLGVSTQWVEIGRSKNFGPRFVRIGPKRIRYRRADVLAWLKSRTHQSTSQYSKRAEVA